MCFALASSPPGAFSAVAVREAAAALDNTALVGEPCMPEDVPAPSGTAMAAARTGGDFYMGQ